MGTNGGIKMLDTKKEFSLIDDGLIPQGADEISYLESKINLDNNKYTEIPLKSIDDMGDGIIIYYDRERNVLTDNCYYIRDLELYLPGKEELKDTALNKLVSTFGCEVTTEGELLYNLPKRKDEPKSGYGIVSMSQAITKLYSLVGSLGSNQLWNHEMNKLKLGVDEHQDMAHLSRPIIKGNTALLCWNDESKHKTLLGIFQNPAGMWCYVNFLTGQSSNQVENAGSLLKIIQNDFKYIKNTPVPLKGMLDYIDDYV